MFAVRSKIINRFLLQLIVSFPHILYNEETEYVIGKRGSYVEQTGIKRKGKVKSKEILLPAILFIREMTSAG